MDLQFWGAIAPIPEQVEWAGQQIPVVLEIQTVREELRILEEANLEIPVNRDLRETANRCARALLRIRDEAVTFDAVPEADLAQRISWVEDWPDALLDEVASAYTRARSAIRKERAALNADPDFAVAQSMSGESSVPSTSSPIAGSPPTSMPSLSSISFMTPKTPASETSASSNPSSGPSAS